MMHNRKKFKKFKPAKMRVGSPPDCPPPPIKYGIPNFAMRKCIKSSTHTAINY